MFLSPGDPDNNHFLYLFDAVKAKADHRKFSWLCAISAAGSEEVRYSLYWLETMSTERKKSQNPERCAN
jgi:hypothetical protein